MITIYNSITNKIENFKPMNENEITMYVCGSTVYHNMHIGNTRPVIFFDVVARFFEYLGYQVKLVSNFTDIDDKIIKRAEEEGRTEAEVSETTIKEILNTYHKLNVLPHYKNPKVTETIPQIIDFIAEVVDKKGGYVVDGDVYFDVDAVKDYAILSGQSKDNLMVGVRIEENEKKRNPIDFNLWKKTEKGLNWVSPWSKGRPGWHTECVVMINDIFKGKIDIHGGGSDIKFPHHDNEIAQANIVYNHNIANYWMHNGRIEMVGEKMSKSLGNIIDADELVNRIGYGVFRMIILNVPYRQNFNYRAELIEQAKIDYEKITRAYIGLYRKLQIVHREISFDVEINDQELLVLNQEFVEHLSDDFNTPNALTVIFKLTKKINNILRTDQDAITYQQHLHQLHKFLWALGIEPLVDPLSKEELDLVTKWQQARKDKDFALADELRKVISDKGIII